MTNLEKYKQEIGHLQFAIVDNQFKSCYRVKCEQCLFYEAPSCSDARNEWLTAEYKEPDFDWSTITVDTPILVSCNGTDWNRRYFARFEKGKVCAWSTGATSWTADDDDDIADWNYAKLAEVNE